MKFVVVVESFFRCVTTLHTPSQQVALCTFKLVSNLPINGEEKKKKNVRSCPCVRKPRQSERSRLQPPLCFRKRGLRRASVDEWQTSCCSLHRSSVLLRHSSSSVRGALKQVFEEPCLRQNKSRPRPRRPPPPPRFLKPWTPRTPTGPTRSTLRPNSWPPRRVRRWRTAAWCSWRCCPSSSELSGPSPAPNLR